MRAPFAEERHIVHDFDVIEPAYEERCVLVLGAAACREARGEVPLEVRKLLGEHETHQRHLIFHEGLQGDVALKRA